MSRLADDIAYLQRAADTAGLVLYPGVGNLTFPDAFRIGVAHELLGGMADELTLRRKQPRDYGVIGYEACWLLRTAQQLVLHRADGDSLKIERFQKLGEYLRAMVEVDLVNARKSLELMA